jgi:hypothetical protein
MRKGIDAGRRRRGAEAWSSGARGRIWCRMVCSSACDSAASREEDGRDRGGVAFPSLAPPPSLPNRSFLLHHRICPGSSLLSHRIWGHEASGAEAGERIGAAEAGKATARGPEDSSPPAFSASSFSLAGAWGRRNGWGPPVGARRPWLCRQNRGSASDVALTRFLGVETK